MNFIRQVIRISRPFLLLDAILLYSLGGGIAHYLGGLVDWLNYFVGMAWVLALQLGATFLYQHSDLVRSGLRTNQGSKESASITTGALFWLGFTALAVAASLTVLLMRTAGNHPLVFIVMGLIFVVAYMTSMIPSTSTASSYRGVLISIGLVNLLPAFAYSLQHDGLHRLLAMSTFPLIALHLAMLLAFELPQYGTNIRYERPTMLVSLGWQRGMWLHNLLVLIGFVLIVMAAALGLPWSIAITALIVLPVGLLQIWTMVRIERGANPNWTLLVVLATATFAVTAYLLTYSFWTR